MSTLLFCLLDNCDNWHDRNLAEGGWLESDVTTTMEKGKTNHECDRFNCKFVHFSCLNCSLTEQYKIFVALL